MLTKCDQYRAGCERAAAKAKLSSTKEIAAIWVQISNSYRLLMEYEERLAVEKSARDAPYPFRGV